MSNKIWTPLHFHSDESNGLHFFEVCTKYGDYVKYAVDNGISSIAVTNHGTVANWITHKLEAEKAGLKYIHGEEGYVAMSAEDKSRYHTILLAKNYEGVKTINQLSSDSFKPDHFYYKPRIFFDDLKVAVEEGNIYVTTACLASGLAQSYFNGDEETHRKWVELAINNKNSVFLEVQPHNNMKQKKYNAHLVELAQKYGLHLIASNDIHALDKNSDKIRKIIQLGKNAKYDDDGQFELWCKNYDEMFADFRTQGVLTNEQIEESLEFTNVVADGVEELELDRSHKYPHLYDDPEKEFQRVIKEGLHKRGIDKLPVDERQKYIKRLNHEYKVYKNNGAIDYMLTDKAMIDAAKNHGINISYGRGSVSGSLIAYLTGSTEMDSVRLGLNFERFMNPERVSLADVDHDWSADDKKWVQEWLLTNPKWHAASILTLNTYGIKGAIKAIADGLPRYKGKPAYIQSIRNQIGDDGYIPESLYHEHKELIDMAKQVVGVIDSFGRHAAGIVVNTGTIEDAMGTMRVFGWDYATTQITMHDIEFCGWVKYDVLGLDNIGLISRTCELAGLPFLTPNSTDIIDFEDKEVWNSMREDNIGIFQFESDRAAKILRDLFSDKTIAKIKERVPNFKYIDLLSLGNAAQRPGSASFVEQVIHGEFKDNGHPALNDFLASTQGFMVYQEQMINFLVQFTGRTPGQADVLRRAVGHKIQSVIDEEVPKIHSDFVKTMVEKYHDIPQHAEQIAQDFMQVFMDAANYGFSINHSMAYSYIGYISTWLRYYYPLEWCTAAFQIWKGKQEKINKVTKFAERHGITMKPVQFRKSKGLYYMDKTTNTIYEGTATIKGCNQQTGDELYVLRDRKYNFFTDLLIDICDNNIIEYTGKTTSVLNAYKTLGEAFLKEVDLSINKHMESYAITPQKGVAINSRTMINLIKLGYFSEFGGAKKLVQVYDFYRKNYNPKNKRFVGKYTKYSKCLEYEQSLQDADYPISVSLQDELSLLGRCVSVKEEAPANLAFVTTVAKQSSKTRVRLYSLKRGQEVAACIRNADLLNSQLKAGNVLRIKDTYMKPKLIKTDGHWVKSQRNQELWIKDFSVVQ